MGLNEIYNEGHLAVHSDIATFLPMDGEYTRETPARGIAIAIRIILALRSAQEAIYIQHSCPIPGHRRDTAHVKGKLGLTCVPDYVQATT